ncbi:MAG: hypothetical protein CMF62_03640 [Magnetococcales bacterium]|nr:hypothetical protein [Magnetococcales bacterium]|tara:strand:- start:21625 stop:22344 length:720 start_codon:yes stop_codon:yes gene_type:complete
MQYNPKSTNSPAEVPSFIGFHYNILRTQNKNKYSLYKDAWELNEGKTDYERWLPINASSKCVRCNVSLLIYPRAGRYGMRCINCYQREKYVMKGKIKVNMKREYEILMNEFNKHIKYELSKDQSSNSESQKLENAIIKSKTYFETRKDMRNALDIKRIYEYKQQQRVIAERISIAEKEIMKANKLKMEAEKQRSKNTRGNKGNYSRGKFNRNNRNNHKNTNKTNDKWSALGRSRFGSKN